MSVAEFVKHRNQGAKQFKFSDLQITAESRKALEHPAKLRRLDLFARDAGIDHTILLADTPEGFRLLAFLDCNIMRENGDAFSKSDNYEEAIHNYTKAMRAFLGDTAVLPSPEGLVDQYLGYHAQIDAGIYIELVECCYKIAQCHLKLNKFKEAIDWLIEVEILYTCQRLAGMPHMPDWKNLNVSVLEYYTLRMHTQKTLSEIFKDLGNTGTSWYYGLQAICWPAVCPDNVPQIEALKGEVGASAKEMTTWRHPDPRFVASAQVMHPDLQVKGHWKKLTIEPGARPPARLGFASWIWRRKMYVAGGKIKNGLNHRDFWCLDLVTVTWRRLPDLPSALCSRMDLLNQEMRVWEDKAWLFTGSKLLWVFDLVGEKWKQSLTELSERKWPYHNNRLAEHSVALLDDTLFVFGGDDENEILGSNIFMSLNLKTLRWTFIGGTSEVKPTPRFPSLRRLGSMWAVPHEKRLYLLYGYAARQAAYFAGKPHGCMGDFALEDLWAYDVPSGKWSRERFRGNFPCPRTEMAYAFNPVLGQSVVYGGYNAEMLTSPVDVSESTEKKDFFFAFYGDSFLMDPSTKSWKHVLVKGFPSYRAQAQFLVDDATGITYLYGGYTNSDFVPSKHEVVRAFADVWQLTLDVPGGHFDEAEFEKDIRMSKMGPFRRCFTCGNCGLAWKKCGGSCGGQYFFCSTECQREGWKEHKQTHACRKL